MCILASIVVEQNMTQKKGQDMETKPTLVAWQELFELAGRIKAMEPWKYYADRELLAVELPGTEEKLYFGFIGMYGTCYGICCYDGDEGLRGHFRACETDANPLSGGAEWIMLEHDALMCYFSDRDEVSGSQKKIIKELGLKFRGSNQWTNFTSYQSEMFPADPDANEVQRLILGYRSLVILLTEVIAGSLGENIDFSKVFPLCRRNAATGTPECSLMPVPKLDLRYPPVRWPDPEKIKSSAKQKKTPLVFLIDLHYLGMPIGDNRNERAGAGLAFVVVEEKGGMIINFQLVDAKEDRVLQCLGWFIDFIAENGRPTCVKVRKEAVKAMFADTCKQCAIELDDDDHENFDILDEAIDGITRGLTGGR